MHDEFAESLCLVYNGRARNHQPKAECLFTQTHKFLSLPELDIAQQKMNIVGSSEFKQV